MVGPGMRSRYSEIACLMTLSTISSGLKLLNRDAMGLLDTILDPNNLSRPAPHLLLAAWLFKNPPGPLLPQHWILRG